MLAWVGIAISVISLVLMTWMWFSNRQTRKELVETEIRLRALRDELKAPPEAPKDISTSKAADMLSGRAGNKTIITLILVVAAVSAPALSHANEPGWRPDARPCTVYKMRKCYTLRRKPHDKLVSGGYYKGEWAQCAEEDTKAEFVCLTAEDAAKTAHQLEKLDLAVAELDAAIPPITEYVHEGPSLTQQIFAYTAIAGILSLLVVGIAKAN